MGSKSKAKAAKPAPKKKAPASKPKAKAGKAPATKVKPKKKKAPAVVPDYATPEALALYDFETAKKTSEMERDVEKLETDYLKLKEKASDAKKMFLGRVVEMRDWVRERDEQRGKPPQTLFDAAERQAIDDERHREYAKTGEAAAKSAAKAPAPSPAKSKDATAGGPATVPFKSDAKPDPDAWYPEDLHKRVPLEKLLIYGLNKDDLKKIKTGETKKNITGIGPLNTMGDLAAFSAPPSPDSTWNRTYADIKGCGPATVDRLTQAELMFWSAWNAGGAEEFALEQGFKKPLKVHEPENADGDDAAAGRGKKGAGRKRKGNSNEPLAASGDIFDKVISDAQRQSEHDAAVEAGEKFEDEE